ncbi:MAG TPA: FAD binding domain-containing protein [Tepidisphaeraceae bacterium]|nr:FAD binding domain-containing protein [Tepidisphaeraceae bacterium]
MRDHLMIFVNGNPLRVAGDECFMTLSDFLRRQRGLTGTKVVCAEGDCGACAVLIGRLDPSGRKLHYTAVNSCIQLMFQLDAAHVVTVEGLTSDGGLNPIQRAMIECHGTQCGFCTPGFVVSLCDLMLDKPNVSVHQIQRALTGNLCRCTGYDSIIQAAMEVDCSSLAFDALHPPYSPAPILELLTAAAGEEVRVTAGENSFYKPVTVEQAVRFRAEDPGCQIVSGATDLGVQRNKGIGKLTDVLCLSGLSSLSEVSCDAETLHVGAAASLTDLESAAAKHLPELAEFLEWFGSPLIRNSGTLAGNLVNGSPIGDCICALFVLDTEIELTSPRGVRQVSLQKFYTGYRRTVLGADEIVTAIHIGLPRPGEVYKLYKISKRKDLDISSFAAAIWMQRGAGTIADVRIAYGGVAPTVVRMSAAESILRGAIPSRSAFEQAGAAARDAVQPITDVRGSAEYRRRLAHNILLKFWNDLGEPDSPPEPIQPAFREPALRRSPEQS